MQIRFLLATAAVALCCTSMAQTKAPAFPGAEGNGRYTTGGRGGKIIHVTNLNDSGTGSLRAAVSGNTKKIIVFDVAGVIPLSRDLKIGANTTILGQTAPYPGITLRYRTVQPMSNNIIRFIRIRRGEEKDVNDAADAIWNRGLTNVILDHCSFSWSIDEVASFYDNNNFTMQWCTLGESLNNAGHGKGAHGYGGIWGGKLASFHHNMIAHVNNRAPRFNGARYDWPGYTSNTEYAKYNWENAVQAENVDFRNCLIFDWGGGGCYGGPGGGYINMVNNYYKATPETSKKNRVTQVSIANSTTSDNPKYMGMTSRYYISGNYVYGYGSNYDWKGVVYDRGIQNIDGERYTLDTLYYYGSAVEHINNAAGKPCVRIKLDTETAPAGEVTTHRAETAYDKILSYCGASFFRDDVDARYMEEAKNGTSTYAGSVTKKKGRIDRVADVKGYTENNFPTGKHKEGYDTDNDGIPDAWEIANGLNPNDPNDAVTYSLDSKGYYTNIEVYANALVEEIMKNGNADAESAVDEYYPVVNKADGIEYYTGRIVKLKDEDPIEPETPITGDEGTITWAFNAGQSSLTATPVLSDNLKDGIAETSLSLGSNFKAENVGTKTVNDIVETILAPSERQPAADASNALTFTVTPADNYVFQPTNVSFTISRIGTDNGLFNVTWTNNSTTTTLDEGLRPNRNKDGYGWYTAYTKTITDVAASADPGSLIINLYDMASDKQFGIIDIVIKGKIGTTNGISNINTNRQRPNTYYNLAGQRVDQSYKGIIIYNGKKYLSK
ncbi:MAG: pectate lyase [Prevotella sp.]|jgi:hypothetical protein